MQKNKKTDSPEFGGRNRFQKQREQPTKLLLTCQGNKKVFKIYKGLSTICPMYSL